MEQQLSALYLHLCRAYDKHPELKYQRRSNFRPRFTDEELLTIYLFGHRQGLYQQRRIYDYVRGHWRAWFPCLPSYQAFHRRLNQLVPVFEHLRQRALTERVVTLAAEADRLIDSLPISLAKWPRSGRARVAQEVADQGFCSTKRSYYYGVKLHVIALRQRGKLPLPALVPVSRASQHDLSALRALRPDLGTGYLFGDKAYADAETKRGLGERGVRLVTPHKRRRHEPETAAPALWARFVSSGRQPVASLFGWLMQRTGMQDASRVRSSQECVPAKACASIVTANSLLLVCS